MPTLISEDKFTSGGTWDGSGGTPVITVSPVPPSGGQSLQCDAIGDFVFWNPPSGQTRLVHGVWIYISVLPTAETRCFDIAASPCEGWLEIKPTSPTWEWFIQGDGTPTIPRVDSGVPGAQAQNTWVWSQVMFDVSADPWQLRGKIAGQVLDTTASAAASNFNGGAFVLGNTTGGSAYTVYFGHVKMGIAANDDDWWSEPSGAGPGDDPPIGFHGRGAGW